MLGAIAGDIIGSPYERHPHKSVDFPLFTDRSRFTDDTVMTVATAHAILTGTSYEDAYLLFGRRYPRAGYGRSFAEWLRSENPQPYGSWGNGSAMRVSPIGWAFDDVDRVLAEAERSALPTHGHPEGVKGAQAVALAVFLARIGMSKGEIRDDLQGRFGYDFQRTVEQIRPAYHFEVSCQGSVPEAIVAFMDSTDWESAVRLAVSLGGDADTQACIAGAVAEAFYKGVPQIVRATVPTFLPDDLRRVVEEFARR
jgi:ADP-ribosylglycohydrolase